MNLYTIEKKKFNEFHSSFHKLLNSIKSLQEMEPNFQKNDVIVHKVMEINEDLDSITSKVIHLKELIYSSIDKPDPSFKYMDNKSYIKMIEHDNRAIKDILPLLFLYRMSLKE